MSNAENNKTISSESTILTIKYNGYSHIVFNRPRNLNTLTRQLTLDLLAGLKDCENDNSVRFIILRGSGRAFCAGGDIKEVVTVLEGENDNLMTLEAILCEFYETIFYMGCVMKTPIISFMDGITFGGGVGLSQLSVFKIATENTTICFPEASIGHFCDAGGSFIIPRMDGYLGLYLGLTGHRICAEDALFAGFATHFMNSANMTALEKRLSKEDNITLDIIDNAILDFSVPANHNTSSYTLHGEKLEIIERCFKNTSVQKIIKALENEESKFAKSCLKSISLCSPTSLNVIMKTVSHGKNKSIAECFANEYRLWSIIPYAHDYREGVSSLLGKRNPRWIPSMSDKIYGDDFRADVFTRIKNLPYMDLKYDCSTNRYQKYHLPTVNGVIEICQKYQLETDDEIISWFLNNRKDKFGIKQKVSDILARKSISSKPRAKF